MALLADLSEFREHAQERVVCSETKLRNLAATVLWNPLNRRAGLFAAKCLACWGHHLCRDEKSAAPLGWLAIAVVASAT
eukprot:CAMPEP_0204301498 /NCGR_PEP_ID=MMETSP0468-20130131/80490_1 /ASSEMBLY_ACC=CAM_ASM_000383 /TAXON_ID=2969 /ORGANISM="Oxyrrhis marina" /LENGTH=78 /DNA_ID=CAMNT_0051280645 /DNA_START=180 /DNA_END=412 /DNA_ORIENTATION=+